jgi:hypothetical protein
MDAVRCAMSAKDFSVMNTTESELLDCVASKMVNAVRFGFGILL